MFAACAPPYYCGGGKQAMNLAMMLAAHGHKVTFITSNLDGETAAYEHIQGVDVHRLDMGGEARVQSLWFLFGAIKHLIRHRKAIDVAHFPSGAFWHVVPILLLACMLGKPTILKLTALGVDDLKSIHQRRFGMLFLWTLRRVSRIVAITDEFRQLGLEMSFPTQQIALIPNGVNIKMYQADDTSRDSVREALQIPLDVCLVLFVGGMYANKGVDTLLDAWERTQVQCPEAMLLLVGPMPLEGSPDSMLVARIMKLREDGGRIRMLSIQDDINRYYQSADIFTLPSRSEGLPNVTLEAMSSKLPVVVSDIGGHRAIVTQEHDGLVVPVSDSEALAESLTRLINDAELREKLGEQARKTVLSKFALEIVAQQYGRLYKEVSR
ncbi:MAG: glycosyltransferase family 4 protein [Candidatus Promineifilaceae bacterium]